MAPSTHGLLSPRLLPRLQPGDKVGFVSPASSPDRESVLRYAKALQGWGLKVDFGSHTFRNTGYLAGTDDERLDDLNTAFVAGVAVGQFTDMHPINGFTIIDLLNEHLDRLNVPVLGGLPFGHGPEPLSTLIGVRTTLDATAQILSVETQVGP